MKRKYKIKLYDIVLYIGLFPDGVKNVPVLSRYVTVDIIV